MHHDEANARLIAQHLYNSCHYNLAIVKPAGKDRRVKIGGGTKDPNELFPPNVAEECWHDDAPCEEFLTKNARATKTSVKEEYAQRQFFLSHTPLA